jgi:hypothetical protein
MKKLIAGLLVTVMAVAVAGCTGGHLYGKNEKYSDFKDTPVRVGTLGYSYTEINSPVSLEAAIKQADIIADVSITGWIDEAYPFLGTLFSADVNDVIKGEKSRLTIMQLGTGEDTIRDFPLFRRGDRMLLFLQKIQPEYAEKIKTEDVNDVYGIIGVYSMIFDVVELDGDKYLLDRLMMNNYIRESELTEVKEVDNSRIIKTLSEQFDKNDPILAEIKNGILNREGTLQNWFHSKVFNYDEIINEFSKIIKEIEEQ